ncbi:Alpha-1-3-glucanase/mutanase [Penicillium waksmanii]|uniref:Alpha-1-3-glucanase/mutanase n=1 Tax=Penicillium waksmanii TaxID=69791 RepID=UPI00254826D4|nr:Alpha-1-3-glucanase/mutanase [Penicillium waksmanii]KAJ5988722.1 Alpha-1-3-glucanase/mutanase [Penicillium waksmanii]
MLQRLLSLLLLALMASLTMTSPVGTGSTSPSSAVSSSSASGGEKLVFCHFMVGICGGRKSANDYDADMKRAKESGIDAFALNIGTDPYTDEQLRFAYISAARNGMKVFLSFDFNWWTPSNGAGVGAKVREYAGYEAQLNVDNKVFVSSFAGDGVDVQSIVSAAGSDIFFAPNFHPGALNWMAWPSNGYNKAPTPGQNVTVSAGDEAYVNALGGKPYIAPVSPWFSTHYGSEVSYSKNWVFPSDLLWYERWQEILQLGPRFVEIITWNDYGESHYVGPLSSPHGDDGNSKWAMDMPHNGWLDMAKPFIAAFKAGSTSPEHFVQEDQLVYWYRPTKRDVNCDATDTTMGGANNASGNFFIGRPNGWESMKDEVFVVSLLKSAAQVHVQSGDQSQTFQAPAGISAHSVPMGVGKQKFAVTRGGSTVLSGISLKDVSDACIFGIYNFNAYVGTLPAPATIDRLQPEGLAMLSKGLKVACPTNTLNAALATSTST